LTHILKCETGMSFGRWHRRHPQANCFNWISVLPCCSLDPAGPKYPSGHSMAVWLTAILLLLLEALLLWFCTRVENRALHDAAVANGPMTSITASRDG
jgi:hypothetical protein